VVVVINDAPAARRITEIVRRINPKVYLIVRTRFLQR
jgi:CPA2 family monovalent cation:H+ antiporter-2